MSKNVSQSTVVALPAEEAFGLFFNEVWVNGRGLPILTKVKITQEGDNNKIGHTRVISPGSVTEKVISYNDPEMFEYTLVNGGLPIKNHRGRVLFETINSEEGAEQTKITWSCVYTPKYLGTMSNYIINNTFKSGLAAFKKYTERKN